MSRLLLRFICLFSLSIWLGGFTFYSAVVIPILHRSLGVGQTGPITQRVTDFINAAGGVTVILWWLSAWVERSANPAIARRARLALLAGSTITLLVLVFLHQVMDRRLESSGLSGFYVLHRAYLIASTAQWLMNLGLFAAVLVLWRDDGSTK
jgi:hypothetical protein